MRAARKLGQPTEHTNQRWQAPALSYLVGMACLLGVLWLSAGPLFAATGCGILIPHDHLLLGGAGADELAAHLSAEAACAAGRSSAADAPGDHPHPGRGAVVSVVRFEPETMSHSDVLGLDQMTFVAPALLALGCLPALFIWRLSEPCVMRRPVCLPPGDPPPEAIRLPG